MYILTILHHDPTLRNQIFHVVKETITIRLAAAGILVVSVPGIYRIYITYEWKNKIDEIFWIF